MTSALSDSLETSYIETIQGRPESHTRAMPKPERIGTVRHQQAIAAELAAPADGLFRTLFENLPNPSYIWQRSGDDFVLVDSNRAAQTLSFSEVRPLIGRGVVELQAGNLHDLRSDLRECLRTRTVIRREVDHRYIASGAVRRLVLTIVPLRDDVAVLHTEDVTDQRAAEHALPESER